MAIYLTMVIGGMDLLAVSHFCPLKRSERETDKREGEWGDQGERDLAIVSNLLRR